MSEDHSTTNNPSKRCGRCQEIKPLAAFGMVKGKPRSYCRLCHAETNNRPDERLEKRCPKCGEIKSTTEFNRCGKRYQPYCRPCNQAASRIGKNKRKESGQHAAWWRGYYEEVKRWARMLRRHGITKEEYERMLSEQNGVCAICFEEETEEYKGTVLRLSVDHDHKTGKVRGLLCRKCNIAIGKFGENIPRMQRAIEYLAKHL